MAEQASGTFVILSECKLFLTERNFWQPMAPEFSAVIQAGYSVRDPLISFDLPLYLPYLPSQDDFYATCGSIRYSVSLVGKDLAQWPDFSVTLIEQNSDDLPGPSFVTLVTEDQNYAFVDCGTGLLDETQRVAYLADCATPYESQFTFEVRASFLNLDFITSSL